MGGVLFFLGLYFAVPILLAKIVVGATFQTILIAYAIWFGALLLFGLGSSRNIGEALGWPLILGMFFTTPALPIIALALKLAGAA